MATQQIERQVSKKQEGVGDYNMHTNNTLTSHASLIGAAVNEFSGTHWVNGVSNTETSFSYTQYFTNGNGKKGMSSRGGRGRTRRGEGVEGENSFIFQVLHAKPLQHLSLHASPHLIRAMIQWVEWSISALHLAPYLAQLAFLTVCFSVLTANKDNNCSSCWELPLPIMHLLGPNTGQWIKLHYRTMELAARAHRFE